jgi:hypothetical protein
MLNPRVLFERMRVNAVLSRRLPFFPSATRSSLRKMFSEKPKNDVGPRKPLKP